jgi:hypothetical protein
MDAAARVLDRAGRLHGWCPATTPRYDDPDVIGKSEGGGIVERMMIAAASGIAPDSK